MTDTDERRRMQAAAQTLHGEQKPERCVECGRNPVRAPGLAHCAACAKARAASPIFAKLSKAEIAALQAPTRTEERA